MSPRSIFRKLAVSLAMFAVVVLGSAAAANADQAIINTPNAGLSGTPGPYATVTYNFNNVTKAIDVTVTMFPGFAAFGDGNSNNGLFGFNIVGSTAGLAITGQNPAFLTLNAGGGQMDGFGDFEATISCCNPPGITSFSFSVTRTGGFSASSDLFEANSNGAHFAIHIAPTNGNPTGFAADSGVSVPEPASMVLLGSGLLGLAAAVRKRFRNGSPPQN